MAEKYYDSLSDMSRIKESLMSLFLSSDDVIRLIMPTLDDENMTLEENWYNSHCFDTPYIEGAITDNKCAIFIETYLTKVQNQRFKEVGVDIMVICHKDSIKLSDEDKAYFNSIGVYGNRVDSAIQVINSTILNPDTMDEIKEKYSIGNMVPTEKDPLKQYIPDTGLYGKSLSYTYQSFYQRKNNVR